MKKILLFFIISSLFSLYSNKVFSYWMDFDGTNFYTSIADSVWELENKIYSAELEEDSTIIEKINDMTWKDCLEQELWEKDLKQIGAWNLEPLLGAISDNCKTKDGNLSNELVLSLSNSAINLHNKTKQKAENKTDVIQDISKVWIYADGITENSPFDLVKDIEAIDEIVFEKTKKYDYKWSTNTDLSKKINEKINNKLKNIFIKKDLLKKKDIKSDIILCKISGKCWTKQETDEEIDKIIAETIKKDKKETLFTELVSKDVCETNTSWLTNVSDKVIKTIIENNRKIKLVYDYDKYQRTWTWWKNKNKDTNKNNTSKNNNNTTIPPYEKVNDNASFPCNSFFCIDISFETYNHNLLWWWVGRDPSLEFLIKRSNKHLKKFTNTSLAQSKMTLNNFELGLKNLKLSEMFHMWMQVSKKPVPILDLNKDTDSWSDKESQEDEPTYALKNQLEEYYKANGLDYKRKNDLSYFEHIAEERLAVDNSTHLSNTKPWSNIRDFYDNLAKRNRKINTIKQAIYSKARTDVQWNYEEQFREIEVFNASLREYVTNLDSILSKMLEIPVDWWTN